MTRGLYKQPGGKLVGVTVRLSHADPDCTDSDYADSDYIDSAHTNAVKTVPYAGPAASSTVIECHIDGDFFLDGDDAGTRNLLHSMECALEQCAARCLSGSMVSERDVTAAVERTMLHHPDVRIVGMGARGIAIAFQRAIDGIDGADGIAGIGGNDVTKVEPRDDLRIRRHTSPMETAETAKTLKTLEPRKATKTLEPLEPAKSPKPAIGRNTRDAGTHSNRTSCTTTPANRRNKWTSTSNGHAKWLPEPANPPCVSGNGPSRPWSSADSSRSKTKSTCTPRKTKDSA